MRPAALQVTVIFGLLLALSGGARAGECPAPDAYSDSTVPGCPSDHPDPNAPIDDGVPLSATTPPTVDPDGNAIPYVEENSAPVEAPTLTDTNPS